MKKVRQTKTNSILFHLYVECKEQNKQTKLKQTQIQVRRLMLLEGRGVWGLGEKGNGIKYKLVVTK